MIAIFSLSLCLVAIFTCETVAVGTYFVTTSFNRCYPSTNFSPIISCFSPIFPSYSSPFFHFSVFPPFFFISRHFWFPPFFSADVGNDRLVARLLLLLLLMVMMRSGVLGFLVLLMARTASMMSSLLDCNKDRSLESKLTIIQYTVKKVNNFPVPSRDVTYSNLSLAGIFPARESLVSGIPAGDGKINKSFYSAYAPQHAAPKGHF